MRRNELRAVRKRSSEASTSQQNNGTQRKHRRTTKKAVKARAPVSDPPEVKEEVDNDGVVVPYDGFAAIRLSFSPQFPLKCPDCDRGFFLKSALRFHISKSHDWEADRLFDFLKSIDLSSICFPCSYGFRTIYHFHSHRRNKHPELFSDRIPTVKCPLNECEQTFYSVGELATHCSEIHRTHPRATGSMYVQLHDFKSMQDFKEWMEDVEEDTHTSFVPTTLSPDTTMYLCPVSHNWQRVSNGGEEEPVRSCTAFVMAHTYSPSHITISYCLNHFCHPIENIDRMGEEGESNVVEVPEVEHEETVVEVNEEEREVRPVQVHHQGPYVPPVAVVRPYDRREGSEMNEMRREEDYEDEVMEANGRDDYQTLYEYGAAQDPHDAGHFAPPQPAPFDPRLEREQLIREAWYGGVDQVIDELVLFMQRNPDYAASLLGAPHYADPLAASQLFLRVIENARLMGYIPIDHQPQETIRQEQENIQAMVQQFARVPEPHQRAVLQEQRNAPRMQQRAPAYHLQYPPQPIPRVAIEHGVPEPQEEEVEEPIPETYQVLVMVDENVAIEDGQQYVIVEERIFQ